MPQQFLVEVSHQVLIAAIRAIDAEIRHISAPVKGDLSKLKPKDQERLMAFSKAALELKNIYPVAQKGDPKLPPYDSLVMRV